MCAHGVRLLLRLLAPRFGLLLLPVSLPLNFTLAHSPNLTILPIAYDWVFLEFSQGP